MNLLALHIVAWLPIPKSTKERVIKWMLGYEEPQGGCACGGKWDKYLETEHGPVVCVRSSHKTVTVHEI